MARLIELKTPPHYEAKGYHFQDWSLDTGSINDNCKRLAEAQGFDELFRVDKHGRRRSVTTAEVLELTKVAILDLGRIVVGHTEYMKALDGEKP